MTAETWDDTDDMCPNCITPWKCNGPHLYDQTPAYVSTHALVTDEPVGFYEPIPDDDPTVDVRIPDMED